MTPLQTLNKYFGYDNFKENQSEIIDLILKGENVLSILPTGAGKSICYQVPSIMSKTFAIVISPLIALMKDQVDSINQRQKISSFINSSLEYREIEFVLNDIRNNEIKILFLSPEKLENRSFAERIKNLSPEFVFVDEAHCISEWGHDFRPSYKKIKEFCSFIEVDKISAFTATATPDVRDDIINQLNFKNPKIIVRGFERPNLAIKTIKTDRKKEKTLEIIKNNLLPAIIYTSTRRNAQKISDFLQANKIKATYYHAGLTPDLRRLIQDDFMNDNIKIIAATNAFGMGVDKKDIRTIIHYNSPGTIENYYQEIGRAGRDGKISNVYLLFDREDVQLQKYFINNANPSFDVLKSIYNKICDFANVAVGSSYEKEIILDEKFKKFAAKDDISSNQITILLNILEENGLIKQVSNYKKKFYFKYLLTSDELKKYLKKIAEDSLKNVLVLLLKQYGSEPFFSKIAIDLNELSRQSGHKKYYLLNKIKELSGYSVLELDSPSVYPTIILSGTRVDSKYLRINSKKLNEKRIHSENKLKEIERFIDTENCRMNYIINYFGESDKFYKCGICDNCTGNKESVNGSIEFLEEKILDVIYSEHSSIKEKELFKLLTGSSRVPAVKNNPNFGILKHYSKSEIKNVIHLLIAKSLLERANDYLTLSPKTKSSYIQTGQSSSDINYDKLELYRKLKQVREEGAKKFTQNPELICKESVMRKIAEEKPDNPHSLLFIEGFTQRNFNKVGPEFLEAIKEHLEKTKIKTKESSKELPENIYNVYELVKKGYGLADISKITKLPEAVISMQIETLIELYPEIEITSLLGSKDIKVIQEEIKKGTAGLKELKEKLPNSISYAMIRIVLAKNRFSQK
ncbi:MAG: RecQ family ATP-dependent DNA helicase [Ignavibacteria bacterium]|jgi:ATP-dependent DNA helicase RecQ